METYAQRMEAQTLMDRLHAPKAKKSSSKKKQSVRESAMEGVRAGAMGGGAEVLMGIRMALKQIELSKGFL